MLRLPPPRHISTLPHAACQNEASGIQAPESAVVTSGTINPTVVDLGLSHDGNAA
jgi:hypothetical protein